MELEDGGENSQINPYQENSFFFVGVICPSRAVKGELQHPIELCQPKEAKSIIDPRVAKFQRLRTAPRLLMAYCTPSNDYGDNSKPPYLYLCA